MPWLPYRVTTPPHAVNTLNWISSLSLLALIFPTLWIIWTKNRSFIHSWIRPVNKPESWLLAKNLPSTASKQDIYRGLRDVVTESKNTEWHASCAYKSRDPATGLWTVGLISETPPNNETNPSGFTFSKIQASQRIRLSCPPSHSNEQIRKDLNQWSQKNGYSISKTAISLSAQSYQCWEWDIQKSESPAPKNASIIQQFSERIFEMREIALYPSLITIIALLLCGTGNYWLIGIGVFAVILMSGAHKFVFMHQREDITQEDHLQNY